jgi:porphobilinogen synthase
MIMVKPALALSGRPAPGARPLRPAGLLPTMSAASTAWSRQRPSTGWLDERRVALETLTSIKRAGADMIITYWAKDTARCGESEGNCILRLGER